MTLNIGIIGTGRIAANSLAPALGAAKRAHLWSVLSRDRGRAAEFAERHGAASPNAAHEDVGAMLADPDLDAVLIATPDRLHCEQAIAAARAGKHVLCEKPLATSVEEAQSMVDACREAGVKLGVAYHMRWHTGHRAVARAVHAGEIGELRHVRVHWTAQAPDASNWRAKDEVGRWWALAGIGTHLVDQIRWMARPERGEIDRIESVTARGILGSRHDETAVVALGFASGVTGELCASLLFEGPKRMEVFGSDGWFVLDDTLGPHGGGSIRSHAGEVAFEPVNPFAGEIDDFAGAVAEDRPPEVDGEEGMRNVEVLVRAG